VFLPLRGRVHLDHAKAEYRPVRNGREGEDLSKPVLRMTLALQRSSVGVGIGLGRHVTAPSKGGVRPSSPVPNPVAASTNADATIDSQKAMIFITPLVFKPLSNTTGS